ncbi:hypothetical protein CRG98_036574 [Punica granatum]|uniref:Uncharacterized protein n=1 Tax=Punica granatum TaxID=22663 RepID=A0A2I0IGF2_PUNGR|nr:hypothetical protein CRG98_036574 [Punica granatum]
MVTMSIDELTSLLMGHDERHSYAAMKEQSASAPLSGILGPPPTEVNFADGRGRNEDRGKGKKGKSSGRGNGSSYGGHNTRFFGDGHGESYSGGYWNGHGQGGGFFCGGGLDRDDLGAARANLAEASSQGIHDLDWYMDSGATHHVTSDLANLNIYDETLNSDHIYVGDGYRCLNPIGGRIFISPQVIFDERSFPFRIGAPISVEHGRLSSGSTSATGLVDSVEDVLAATTPDETKQAPPLVPPPTQNTHRMVTRAKDGSLPPLRFVISRHPTAFSVSTALQEPHSFAQARKHSHRRAATGGVSGISPEQNLGSSSIVS